MTVAFALKDVLYSDAPAIEFADPLPEHGAVAVGHDIAHLLVAEFAFELLDQVSCRYQDGEPVDEPVLSRADELIVHLAGLGGEFELHAGAAFGVFIVRSEQRAGLDAADIAQLADALRALGMNDVTAQEVAVSQPSPEVIEPPARPTTEAELDRKLARCAIGDFPSGHAGRIVGALDLVGQPLHAPISRRPCAAYVVTVDEYMGESTWRTALHVIRSLDFLAIRDDTGSALVELDQAQVHIVADEHVRTGFLQPSNKRIDEFLASYGQTVALGSLPRRLRVKEGVLEPSETIAVIGEGVWEASAQAALHSFRSNARRVAFRASERCQLLVTDEPSLTVSRVRHDRVPVALITRLKYLAT